MARILRSGDGYLRVFLCNSTVPLYLIVTMSVEKSIFYSEATLFKMTVGNFTCTFTCATAENWLSVRLYSDMLYCDTTFSEPVSF